MAGVETGSVWLSQPETIHSYRPRTGHMPDAYGRRSWYDVGVKREAVGASSCRIRSRRKSVDRMRMP
jgi:hypothetical protein